MESARFIAQVRLVGDTVMSDMSSQNALLLQKKLHATSLKALDVNPFQPSLIATGASAAEVRKIFDDSLTNCRFLCWI